MKDPNWPPLLNPTHCGTAAPSPSPEKSPPSMAKTKPGKKDLDSYTIKGTNKTVKVGDCVLMRPSDPEKPPYVARVEKIEANHRSNERVRVRWYYRPEESLGGRRPFHGSKELFLSDHYDVQSAHTIEGKCTIPHPSPGQPVKP